MNTDREMKARRLLAVAAACVSAALLAGCGGGDGDGGGGDKSSTKSAASSSRPSAPEGSDPSRSESTDDSGSESLAEAKDGDISLTIQSAVRDAAGYVTVSGTVQNNGNSVWLGANWRSDERELSGNGGSMAGSSLVDQKGKKKYLILRDTSGKCLCTKFDQVRSGQTTDWYAQFPAPPEATKTVTFQVGSMPPAEIPLSEAR